MLPKPTELWGASVWALKEAIHLRLHRSTLPDQMRDDDLFIVEFPKSGITWLSFLIANANLILNDSDQQITFFNICDFIPDIHAGRFLGPPPLPRPGYRCIKSHAPINPYYRKVVYLVRDPRHVMLSYYHFRTQLGWYSGTFEEMVNHPRDGIEGWCNHVNGWLDRVSPATSFILLRYEDLLADTAGQLQHLYRLLGQPLSEAAATAAVERSSLTRMREEENLFNAGHPSRQGFDFVRKGDAGGGRSEMSPDIQARIEQIAGPLMQRLGYV